MNFEQFEIFFNDVVASAFTTIHSKYSTNIIHFDDVAREIEPIGKVGFVRSLTVKFKNENKSSNQFIFSIDTDTSSNFNKIKIDVNELAPIGAFYTKEFNLVDTNPDIIVDYFESFL